MLQSNGIPFANSSIRVLSRGQAEVLGYKFSSRLFLVGRFRPRDAPKRAVKTDLTQICGTKN